ncbi:TetR family transcriptional regulator [Micromonospora sp. WMMD812]|uniref:TetR family transcriptional regulator n=1 Tax=Micromonospora sp. WMMD812 TaxID=3015152 RepID=UPI00248BE634|nr:TetR family transcriptional regulator [Micromonospora sp. WMMD812]WBB69063.1 TetR family transcriptional regulator [Micromonospora sp. WMMD812]
MPGDSAATQRRLIEAAIAEFAALGIAGARVDRIAAAAKSNKAQIYQYFGNKDALFDAAFNALVVTSIQEAPIDPLDLPEYAGRLFDGYEKRPELLRMATWYRLERGGTTAPLEPVVDNIRDKLDAIAAAQGRGDLPGNDDPVTILGLVLHLAQVWSSASPEFAVFIPRLSKAQRRAALVDAVRRVLTY